MNNGFGSVQLEVVIAESTTRLPEHWLCAQPRVAGEAAPCAAGPVTLALFPVGATAAPLIRALLQTSPSDWQAWSPLFCSLFILLSHECFFCTYDPNH